MDKPFEIEDFDRFIENINFALSTRDAQKAELSPDEWKLEESGVH